MIDTPLKAALVRGSILAVIAAGSVFFATLGSQDVRDIAGAAIAMGAAFFAVLGARIGEGAFDQRDPIQRSADAAKPVSNTFAEIQAVATAIDNSKPVPLT